MSGNYILPQPWANSSLAVDADALLGSVEQGLSVRLIATSRKHLEMCEADEILQAVATRNEANNKFDHLPVTRAGDGNARIHGLIRMVPFLYGKREPNGRVRDYMEPLSEENLISADAGILSFVRNADTHPCRFVIAGPKIVGLVSLSDIQRLPVRPVLFMLITHLELLMTEVINAQFEHSDRWKDLLTAGRRKLLEKNIDRAKSSNIYVSSLLMTQFCDKRDVISQFARIKSISYMFEHDMKIVEELRNALAHASEYASTLEKAKQTCFTVRIVEKWIACLRCPSWRAAKKS